MSNIYPNQERSIDPYSSYNSNTFNAFTRIVSGGNNAILSNNAVEVLIDSTSPQTKVVITPGICFKDDVMINFTDLFKVDFTDVSFYDSTTAFNEEGYYYVLLEYSYTKSIPAPQAAIKILKPSQRMSLSVYHLMLKIVEVSFNGVSFEISNLWEYDPEIPNHKRQYTTTFASLVDTLPTFDSDHDKGMIVYDRTNDLAYMGLLDGWGSIASFDYPCDAHLCSSGQLAYLDTLGVAHPAIATSVDSFALGFVVRGGFNGLLRLSGFISNGAIEAGNVVHAGDRVFLSKTVPGAVTSTSPVTGGIYQAIGRCFATDGTATLTTVLCTLGNVANVIPAHNNLDSLQGGDSSNRYHLTLSNYNHVSNQDFTHNNLTSKQGGDGTNFHHLSLSNYNHVTNQDFTHNNLTSKEGGDGTHFYHLSQAQYNNAGTGVPVGTIVAFFPGYIDQTYNSFVLSLIPSNDPAGVNSYLASIGGSFHLCDGSAPNDPASPIWNTSTKHLPILMDSRFLEGVSIITYGSYGCQGGVNSVSHSHGITVDGHAISINEMPAHHHTYNGIYGAFGADYGDGYRGTSAENTSDTGGGLAHSHTASSGSATTENRPQYLQCFYIIRVK